MRNRNKFWDTVYLAVFIMINVVVLYSGIRMMTNQSYSWNIKCLITVIFLFFVLRDIQVFKALSNKKTFRGKD
jgi:hypothetical protein